MPPPPQAHLNKWILVPESTAHAFFNPLVVVTVMTTIALIIAVLSIVTRPPSKTIVAICVLVGIFGLIAVIYEIRRLVRLDAAKIMISRLLAEGEQTALYIMLNSEAASRFPKDYPQNRVMDQEYFNLMSDWCRRTDDALRKYLDESYVTRVHLGGSIEQDQRSMTIWKARHRLETLASFLTELR
jgi:hypothetical protein